MKALSIAILSAGVCVGSAFAGGGLGGGGGTISGGASNSGLSAGSVVTNAFWEQFGCKGDALKISDATTVSNSTSLTSISASFTAADVGKAFILYSDITNISYTYGTISAVNSSSNITMSVAAQANWTNGGSFIYGFNNFAAFSNMLATITNGTYDFAARGGCYLIVGGMTPNTYDNAMFKLYAHSGEEIAGGAVTLRGTKPICRSDSTHVSAMTYGTKIYLVATNASTVTNTIFSDNAPFNFDSMEWYLENIYFTCPVNPQFSIWRAPHGGRLEANICTFQPDWGTNTDAFSTGFLYEPLAYRQNTNGFRCLLAPGPANSGGITLNTCFIQGWPVGISAGEHSHIYRTDFDYCGTGILVSELGIQSLINGADNYFFACRNAIAVANTPVINYQPIRFENCGLENHGWQISQFEDMATPVLSGFVSFYNEDLTNFTSPNLGYLKMAGNATTAVNYPQVTSANFSGNGLNITNLNFANFASNVPPFGVTWQIPQVCDLAHVGGGWHMKANNTWDCGDSMTVNSQNNPNPYLRTVFGSQIFQWQFRRGTDGAPSISDLGNAQSVICWPSNGCLYATGSTNGTTTWTKQIAP